MLVSTRDRKLIKKYPYKTTPLERVFKLETFGFEQGAYGGRASMIAKVKNSLYYLIVDKHLETIDVCVQESTKDKSDDNNRLHVKEKTV